MIKKTVNAFCCGGDESLIELPEAETEDHSEEYQAVFRALHTLGAMYRDILVDYYVHELDTLQISVKYGISVGNGKMEALHGQSKNEREVFSYEQDL